jgi:hypothetical protein
MPRILSNSALLPYGSEEQTSLGSNAYGWMEYAMTERTNIGAGARLDAAADWFEGTAFLHLRQTLSGKLYKDQQTAQREWGAPVGASSLPVKLDN